MEFEFNLYLGNFYDALKQNEPSLMQVSFCLIILISAHTAFFKSVVYTCVCSGLWVIYAHACMHINIRRVF
jgi:hypothetical protein